MVLMLFAISVCTIVDFGISKIPRRVRPPVSCVIYIMGILLSWMALQPEGAPTHQRHGVWGGVVLDAVNSVEDLDPHVIFFLFLPSLYSIHFNPNTRNHNT